MLTQIVNFKKLNQDVGGVGRDSGGGVCAHFAGK
jgi:hypothetical protein